MRAGTMPSSPPLTTEKTCIKKALKEYCQIDEFNIWKAPQQGNSASLHLKNSFAFSTETSQEYLIPLPLQFPRRRSKERIKKFHITDVLIYLLARIIHIGGTRYKKLPERKNTSNLSGRPDRMSNHCNRIARSWKLPKTTSLLTLKLTEVTRECIKLCPHLC